MPDLSPAKLLFFWDYDTQWGADRSRSPGGGKDWGRLDFENTERLLELHAEYSVMACFAVVGQAAKPGERPYHDPSQILRIHQAGHEIGSHSFRHEWLPALRAPQLYETLSSSKAALEDCIGAPVVTFVPPYNQPFDYWERGSISISERRAVRGRRTDLPALCEALYETGYRCCRVAYRPWHRRMIETVSGRRIDTPVQPEVIGGIQCVRLNTPGGFTEPAAKMLDLAMGGKYVVVYGHPHSASSANSQSYQHLIPFLARVQELRRAGRVEVVLPRALQREQAA